MEATMNSSSVRALTIAAGITLASAAAFGQTVNDKQFLTDAIQGDMAEVQLGQLAEAKGNTEGVRNFGVMLASDHAKAQAQALSVASAMGVQPPQAPKPEAKQEYDELSQLSGAAFDAEFVKYMVADHEKDIAKFKAEAKSGSGAAAQMASAQLPTLEHHLATAQTLEKQAGQ